MVLILGTAAYAAPSQLVLVSGSTGGTYYALGGAMAASWNKHLDTVNVSCIASGASVENMNLLQTGEADLGLAMNSIADAAWNGKAPFTSPMKDFRTLGVVYPEVFQMVASQASGATTLQGLKGKKVAIGPVGSGSAVASEIVFTAAGMDIAKDIQAQRDTFANAGAKMQDGHVDASSSVLVVPASSIIELKTTLPLNYIEIDDAVLAAIRKDYPFYTRFLIPAGTYGNEAPIKTITCQAALYCRAELNEEEAYELTKAFYEFGGEVGATHAAGKYISLKTALDGITTPLHPGAARYFKEKGIVIPPELAE